MDSKIYIPRNVTSQKYFGQEFAAFLECIITIHGVDHFVAYYNCINENLQFTSISDGKKRTIQIPLDILVVVDEAKAEAEAEQHHEDKVYDTRQVDVVMANGNLPYINIEEFKKRIIRFYWFFYRLL